MAPNKGLERVLQCLSGCLDPSKNVLGLGKVSKWHPAREHDVYEHQHPLGRQVYKRIAGRVVRPVIGQLDRVLPGRDFHRLDERVLRYRPVRVVIALSKPTTSSCAYKAAPPSYSTMAPVWSA